MSLTVFIAVILAASLHAVWNAMVKKEDDKYISLTAIVLGHVPISIIVIFFIDRIARHLISADLISILVLILGGLILSGSLFSMILGHWYLNVVNLPISLLRSATKSILVFLSLRAVWNVFALFSQSVNANGFEMSLTEFLWTLEGIFLWCGIFFGTLLPLVLSYLALRTVAIHSTQSATGLLYVLVISVLMGDLFYKFYSIQYALFL